MQQYSENFKARMVERLVGERAISANALSQEVGLSQATLSRWLREAGRVATVRKKDYAKPRAARPEDWSAQEKLEAVPENVGRGPATPKSMLLTKRLPPSTCDQLASTSTSRAFGSCFHVNRAFFDAFVSIEDLAAALREALLAPDVHAELARSIGTEWSGTSSW